MHCAVLLRLLMCTLCRCVVAVCELEHDLAILPDGDMTEIGEKVTQLDTTLTNYSRCSLLVALFSFSHSTNYSHTAYQSPHPLQPTPQSTAVLRAAARHKGWRVRAGCMQRARQRARLEQIA